MTKPLPANYAERVYAGVLGKLIGVYLGRPVENWSYEAIVERFGEVSGYVHQASDSRLVVTDDDLSGTFTFLRALEDYGYPPDISAAQVGRTWLNYIIENKSILWWGGLYHSTEHTAFLHLQEGIEAPRSGSLALNGPIIANQIGAQIYIDGWAMVAAGDPEYAAHLAQAAASVSHDDEALNAARVIAAMEAQAFVESDINRLIDTALALIPPDSIIYRLINDLREWHAQDQDWRKTRERIVANYGYKQYVGGCHVVPNHALIQLGLLYGEGDFRRSLMITTTSGWDTDCNAGNLGCLLGIRSGVAAFADCTDLREPVADRLLLSTADGGRCITDAAIETGHVINAARRLRQQAPWQPKQGAGGLSAVRFHFELPGSVQGFAADPSALPVKIANMDGHSRWGERTLALTFQPTENKQQTTRVASSTFILPGDLDMPVYTLYASPTLYPGQTVRAGISAAEENQTAVSVRLYLNYYNQDDQPARCYAAAVQLPPGDYGELSWQIPDTNGGPIFEIGVELSTSDDHATAAQRVYLDYLGWDGAPTVTFTRPSGSSLPHCGPMLFRRAWIEAVEHWEARFRQSFRIIQDHGRGLIATGTREWHDYEVSATITPAKFQAGGLAARVQGLRRYYALLLVEVNRLRLVKALDGDTILAEVPFPWNIWQPYHMQLRVEGNRLRGWVNGRLLIDTHDPNQPLLSGGIALVVERGHLATPAISVCP